MNASRVISVLLALVLGATASSVKGQTDTTFTYQGRLLDNGAAADGAYDLDFSLWDDPGAGTQIGSTISLPGTSVNGGLFSVELDFGADAFDGGGRWLAIAVSGTPLSPRQPLTRAPYAIQTRGIFVNANQRVGIGTTAPSPEATLHIQDNTGDNFGVLVDSYGVAGSRIGLHVGPSGYSSLAKNAYFAPGWTRFDDTMGAFLQEVSPSGDVTFYNAASDSGFINWNTPLAFSSEGDVGVGGAPTARRKLHVIQDGNYPGPGSVYAGLFEVSTDNSEGIHISNTGVNNAWGAVIDTHGITVPSLSVSNQGGGPAAYFNAAVGVGTLSPAYTLEVNGTAGKPGGGSWTNSSDRRLKKNIADLDGALDHLLELRGVTFEYIDPTAINELPGQRIGMIAQEVEEVFPDWVETGGRGYKTVTYRGFEALTVEALRDLRDEKDAQIAALEQRVGELERLVERLASTDMENQR